MSGEPERGAESSRMPSCPQEATLTDFLAGLLSEETRGSVLAHLESCADCRWVLVAGAGAEALSSASEVVAKEPLPLLLVPGARVSRYVVRERLGSGAMGVVYAADDLELGRRVALKMLRPEGRQREELRQRLLREAQALARLSHPNVVTLYDVGTHGDGVFLAMELVEGTTLAEWMKQPRPWKDVLRVFLEAGKGLAAAHAAGLVHRDFKPANTLLGKHGRVFVTDFGIAGPLHQEEGAPLQEHDKAPVASMRHLTRTGQLLGTPAYMAPELIRGQRADARSDAFSFCVALHEALFGARPFQGETLKDLAQAARQGSISPPKYEVKIPAHVQRALLRGLRSSPEERFPSMESLLAALTPRPIRWLARMMATATVAGVLGTLAAYGATHQEGSHCEQEVEKLAAAWSPARRERIRAAFLSTGASYAAPAWEQLASVLDTHATQWRTLRTEACLAAGSDTGDKAWQTAACLDARLWQLAAVTEVLEKADAETVKNAHQLTASLEGLTGCRDTPGLSSRPQPPEILRPRVDEVRRKLAQAQADLAARRLHQGLGVTEALIQELRGLDYRPLEAEVLVVHGELHQLLERGKEAETFLYQALWAAEAGRDDESAARALLLLVSEVADAHPRRNEEVEKLIRHAQAAVERLGRGRFPDITADLYLRVGSARMIQLKDAQAEADIIQGLNFVRKNQGPEGLRIATLLHRLGWIRLNQGRLAEAMELHRQALEQRKRLLGSDHPLLVRSYDSLASTYMSLGRRADAIDAWHRALAIIDAADTPETPELARMLQHLAIPLRFDDQWEEALSMLERSRVIFESALGPDNLNIVMVLREQAAISLEAGRNDEALRLSTQAVEHAQRAFGPATSYAAWPLKVRARVHLRAGRHVAARRDLQEALSRLERELGPKNGGTAAILIPLAELALVTQAPKEALAYCERARNLLGEVQASQSVDVASALACAGEAHLALGGASKAVPMLERARNLQRQQPDAMFPEKAAKTSFLLARALVDTHTSPDRARALTLAEEARAGMESAGARGKPELQKILAWQRRMGQR
ncbi:protein kinase [Corallococcus praedator]|uniref:Protein kinase n=1 Tax=Corallococcus praedator TaxID=2316724 RepID=A0ABX9QQ14_9BACT|nr:MULTISPECIES: tetratricopeptide repeat protein [Corallococcus]RKH20767.1 protein kinase [Corallococcus sp. CA047B]RKH33364.1 protein kinase [Corallococcus sp. CA031C]RKI16242.1 protein kinase [Corallococcus praedator]